MKDIAQQTGASGIQREMDDDPKGGKTGKQLLDHSLNPCFSQFFFLEDGLFVCFFLQMCDSQNISSKHSKGTKTDGIYGMDLLQNKGNSMAMTLRKMLRIIVSEECNT